VVRLFAGAAAVAAAVAVAWFVVVPVSKSPAREVVMVDARPESLKNRAALAFAVGLGGEVSPAEARESGR
jgi:hypothetical protein